MSYCQHFSAVNTGISIHELLVVSLILESQVVRIMLIRSYSWGGREKSLAEKAKDGVEEAKGKAAGVADKVKETAKQVTK
jgi:hypothetical protein